jgi:hypothetical protein
LRLLVLQIDVDVFDPIAANEQIALSRVHGSRLRCVLVVTV